MSASMKHLAPCGHIGEPIIGAYVACRSGCDSKPTRCGRCGSEKIAPFHAWGTPSGSLHCRPCGHVWWSPLWP